MAAKRRGVVEGVDFGFTGEVRFVVREAVRRQLDNDNIVLLSNLGGAAAARGGADARGGLARCHQSLRRNRKAHACAPLPGLHRGRKGAQLQPYDAGRPRMHHTHTTHTDCITNINSPR